MIIESSILSIYLRIEIWLLDLQNVEILIINI